jgi:hypothetical protein
VQRRHVQQAERTRTSGHDQAAATCGCCAKYASGLPNFRLRSWVNRSPTEPALAKAGVAASHWVVCSGALEPAIRTWEMPSLPKGLTVFGFRHVSAAPKAALLMNSCDGGRASIQGGRDRQSDQLVHAQMTFASAADLKFLHHLQQTPLGTSNRKAALES